VGGLTKKKVGHIQEKREEARGEKKPRGNLTKPRSPQQRSEKTKEDTGRFTEICKR